MVAVFSIFATLSVIEFKMIGIGLATAILIDATVVRGVLMPAAGLLRCRGYLLTGNPRLTPPWLGSSQREVTALPRV
jgi:putative drug exporter of the RND superfamily